MAPRNAYFELEAQPDRMIPYTPMDVMAMMYSRLASIFASTRLSVKGTTAHAARAGAIASIGAMTKIPLLAVVGTIISLSSNFKPSAIGFSGVEFLAEVVRNAVVP